jgi:hypothetical protein
MNDPPTTLAGLVALLKGLPPSPRPKGEEKWDAMIARISTDGQVHEIDEKTYDYFVDVLPPRWMGPGGFAFGEGADALKLFWSGPRDRFYVRQLTWDEHLRFVRLARIGLSSG